MHAVLQCKHGLCHHPWCSPPSPPQAHPFPALLLTVGALVMQMKVRHRQQLLRFALKPHVCTCVCLAGVVLLACSANSAP